MLKLKQIIPLAATTLSLAIISPIQAATIQVNSDGQLTGIKDLLVDLSTGKTLFDVTFSYQIFENIFGDPNNPSPLAFFWNNSTDADTTLTAMNQAINAANPIPSEIPGILIGSDGLPILDDITGETIPNPQGQYYIPVGLETTGGIDTLGGSFQGITWDNAASSVQASTDPLAYAVFQQLAIPVIPEPSSVIGLIVIGSSCFLLGRGGGSKSK